MKSVDIISKLSVHPERVFTRETEEGLLCIYVHKKGEIIQELQLPDGGKKRVALKFSVHDNEEWNEVVPEITWEEAIRGYIFNNRGFMMKGENDRTIYQRPDEHLGGVVIFEGEEHEWDAGFTREELLTYKFYPHYEFEETEEDIKASWNDDFDMEDILDDKE